MFNISLWIFFFFFCNSSLEDIKIMVKIYLNLGKIDGFTQTYSASVGNHYNLDLLNNIIKSSL